MNMKNQPITIVKSIASALTAIQSPDVVPVTVSDESLRSLLVDLYGQNGLSIVKQSEVPYTLPPSDLPADKPDSGYLVPLGCSVGSPASVRVADHVSLSNMLSVMIPNIERANEERAKFLLPENVVCACVMSSLLYGNHVEQFPQPANPNTRVPQARAMQQANSQVSQ